ncbi:MAG: CDP-diacylglycerol--glycerol-3-phosphate 3-phosphatidyltransferase [Gammaproteobacteria bacterium]|nr:CDP-diacylglycerol--glycerol-3-phosphate 3-phosphatidyltransferase [Gammaproteobacteria bacterium]
MHYTIPNLLTSFRILLVPVFVICFYLPVDWANQASAYIFMIAAITDWFDGYLARKLDQTSAFGAFLDPVADKLMVAVALVLLVDRNPTDYPSIFMTVAAIIIIGREITISALREWMAEVGSRTSVAVSIIGKIKTTAQMVALTWLLYAEPLLGVPLVELGFILLYVAVFLTLWSMIDYISSALPALKE